MRAPLGHQSEQNEVIMQNVLSHVIESVKKEPLSASHAAICDGNTVRWHRDDKGNIYG
jgi:hypothetical protein